MRINQKALQLYRKTHGREVFCTKQATYDIVVAQFLLEKGQRAIEKVSVDQLAVELGFDRSPVKEEDGLFFFQAPSSSSRVVIDGEYFQREFDLEKPLIFDDQGQLLDGHHRLYRAFMLGVEVLRGQRLTAEETRLCC